MTVSETSELLLRSPGDVAAFSPDRLDTLAAFFRANGFVILRGGFAHDRLDRIVEEGLVAQTAVADGRVGERYGTTRLVDDDGGERTAGFPNYVTHVTEIAPLIQESITNSAVSVVAERLLGPCWLLEGDPFGVVYQDARASRESSYSRIGWHSDWQSGPHLKRWPSVAFTIHLDATSPANGFLRVVPGSHLWATPAPYQNANNAPVPDGAQSAGGYTDTPPPFDMPLGFEKIGGEAAVYCEFGDVLFHDAYLWHAAARATDDATIRRHVRGAFYAGVRDDATEADFVKNAAR